MTWSRKTLLVAIASTLVATTACSRFAPKAGVDVREVPVRLAFGVEVEDLTSPPPLPTPTQSVIVIPSASPTPPLPPPPPPPPFCLPNQSSTFRDGTARSRVADHDFDPNNPQTGGKPRPGNYPTYYEFNYSGDEAQRGYEYRTVDDPTAVLADAFGFWVYDSVHGIDWDFQIVMDSEEASTTGNNETDGIYLQSISLPRLEQQQGSTEISKEKFVAGGNGIMLMGFPVTTGESYVGEQPYTFEDDSSTTSSLTAPVVSIRTTIGGMDEVYVCDQLASAFRVSMDIRLQSVDFKTRIVGNFWFATQYGGWPIQESFVFDGGNRYRGGNFLSRLARLDPGDVL